MAMIGTFGNIPFVVSADTIRTFEDFQRQTKPRWAKHDLLNSKPKVEFVGPDLDTIQFKMKFNVAFGINPRKAMDELVTMANKGEAHPLVVGGKGLGVYRWTIISLSQYWEEVDNLGNVLSGSVDIELQEYPFFEKKKTVVTKKTKEIPCGIKVNGKTLAEKGFVRNGQGYVPIRIVLRELGHEKALVWTQSRTTINGAVVTTFLNKDGTGFAWSREIGELLGVKVTWQQGIIEFNS